jgi:hypothetical protein
MTASRCTTLPPTARRRPAPRQHSSSDPGLVGRSSAPAPGRALVPTAPPRGPPGADRGPRPSGNFLAQLIATALQAPQTRARRRAEPADASAVYAAAATEHAETGRVLRRTM